VRLIVQLYLLETGTGVRTIKLLLRQIVDTPKRLRKMAYQTEHR
jgi:hypothetical protein